MTAQIKVLMVCLGNICRSPTAEAVFRAQVDAAGLGAVIAVDSAGTSNWHVGEAPDPRSIRHAAARRYDLAPLRARQVQDGDFADFDYILAMDLQNLRELQQRSPAEQQYKLGLLLDHGATALREVPDPYDHDAAAFEAVLDLVEAASAALLATLCERHALQPV